jgi:alkylation response protein AidB-like acyl-CoA dehydrogenase
MKVYGSEAAGYAVDEAVQIFGGNGYSKEYAVERDYRNARPTRIFEGTNEINRLLIVDMLIKRAMSGALPLVDIGQQVLKDVYQTGPLTQLRPEPKTIGQFSVERVAVANMKKAAIMLLGLAAEKWMMALAEQQEVVAAISDCIIEIYAAESTLLRTLKRIAEKGEEESSYHIDMMHVLINDAVTKMELIGKQTLTAITEGLELSASIKSLQRLLQWESINTVVLRRRIADRLIEAECYPFE